MGRLVRVPRELSIDPSGSGKAGGPVYIQADSYLERVAKYVPAEVIAFSIFINTMLYQATRAGGPEAVMAGMPVSTIATAVVIAGTVLTPLFMWYLRKPGDAWITNAFVSTLLFPVWSYALGSVAFSGYWDGNLAAITLASATIMSGLISPRLPRSVRKRRQREQEIEERAPPHAAPARPPLPSKEPIPAAVAVAGRK
jgi:hypothetical protein